MPRISICVPVHDMENGSYFFKRLTDSLEKQTFKDFELIVTKEGKMAENTNAAIKQAKGEIIKILFMDDFFASSEALQHIQDSFKGGWLASGCVHTEDGVILKDPHYPSYNHGIARGNNSIGSPSVVAFENKDPLLFDENLSWVLDCDLYTRLYNRYGYPTIINETDIAIGLGMHQTTNRMGNDEKLAEYRYLEKKYA